MDALPNPVLAAARAEKLAQDDIYTTTSGVRVRFKSVPPGLISRIASEVPEPPVPMWFNPEKEREEPNPSHPDYQRELQTYGVKRVEAMLDASIMFGVELVDGLPKDDSWIERLTIIKVPVGESQIAKEFAYKRYVAIASNEDVARIFAASSVGAAQITRAEEQFRR